MLIGKQSNHLESCSQARKVDGPTNAEYGLVFRIKDEQKLFFAINDSGRVYIHVRDAEGNWLSPLFEGYSENIKVGESNKLVVFEQDDHYIFCVNQYVVGEAINSDYPNGKFGVGVDLSVNDEAVFEFDDFTIYAPTK